MKIYHTDRNEIRDLLLWRSVSKVSDDTLMLDDGRTLRIIPNEGCGGCADGNYDLEELNDSPNAITAVEFEEDGDGDTNTYRVFVYAENQKIKLLEVSGYTSWGGYGYGYWITVTDP